MLQCIIFFSNAESYVAKSPHPSYTLCMNTLYQRLIQSSLLFSFVVLPVVAQADTIKTVTGLPNGKIQIEYDSGKSRITKIFSGLTSDTTHVAELSNKTVLALQANGRKIAWINATVPADLKIDKMSLVDDVRYTSAALRVHDFGDDTLPVVVAKRGATVDVFLTDRMDGELEIVDQTRVLNKNIVPGKTTITNQSVIQLRNSKGRVIERVTVAGDQDLQLFRQNDPVSCVGQLYESHAHNESSVLAEYVERLNDHGVGCSLLFLGVEWDNLADTYIEAKAIVQTNPGRFVPFYNSDPNTLAEVSVENLQSILDYDTEQMFRGIGEFAFYRSPLIGTTLTSDPWPEIFQWAGDNDLIIMIHLNQDQGTELDTMLDAYPNTQVLLHGKELASAGDLATLLAEHSNLYYTLDTANMVQVDGSPIMFPLLGGEEDTVSDKARAADFIEAYDANEATMLTNAQTLFADIFTAAPNQILWGTDVASTWHMRPAVYRRLIEFSTVFAADLSAEQQEDYLMNNAQTLFGDGVTID